MGGGTTPTNIHINLFNPFSLDHGTHLTQRLTKNELVVKSSLLLDQHPHRRLWVYSDLRTLSSCVKPLPDTNKCRLCVLPLEAIHLAVSDLHFVIFTVKELKEFLAIFLE